MQQAPTLVLASASPRRRALLAAVGLDVTCLATEIDEASLAGEPPEATALRLARAKAQAAADRLGSDASSPSGQRRSLVIAADTIVDVDGRALGKPRDARHAARMLGWLSGRSHLVHTGLALVELPGRRELARLTTSRVRFAHLDGAEIDWYRTTGEGADKAGGYALQGLASLFIEAVDGSASNVVGLPLQTLYALSLELGWDLKRLCRPDAADRIGATPELALSSTARPEYAAEGSSR